MQDSYVWVDIETTGLNVKKDKILEVGIIITDRENAEKARTSMVIKHPARVLSQMDPWAIDTHTRNGLITESKSARYPINIADAVLTEWLKEMVGNLAKPYMCGTSVHFDREFLKRYMPRLEACFHYRNFDIATLREFFEVDHRFVVIGALSELVRQGKVKPETYRQAIKDLELDVNKLNPMIS